MEQLGVIQLYQKEEQNSSVKEFVEKTESKLSVEIDRKRTTQDTEWIEIMEATIPYIDNIFRNPNRFIVNEEEVVKIEQAKKITVESIKHLSKNTNFIQTIDEVTGDVTPAKLLNVRKEESYDTYENRLIYTLVQNMKMFIGKKKELLITNISVDAETESNKDNKNLEYSATSIIDSRRVNLTFNLSSKLENGESSLKEKDNNVLERIEEIEKKIQILSDSEPYKVIDKQHISLVREPIRKTNVVLKNVNFQYAMKLWSYLRDNFDENFVQEEEKREYTDNGQLKQFVDETFLLQYLAMKTLDEDEQENETTNKEIQETMIDQMIEKMVEMDVEVTGEEIAQMISSRYEVVKYKKMEIINEIQKIFKTHIQKYEEQLQKGE